jgi:hypothetical protein
MTSMRKEYGKVLRERFSALMKQHLPQFQPTKYPAHPYVWPGDRIFRWIPREPLHCFIILVPDKKGYDDFTLEIGWSTLGRYPEVARGIALPTPERTEFEESEFLCRLPRLVFSLLDDGWGVSINSWNRYTEYSAEEHVHAALAPLSVEEARAAMIPAVEEAMKLLLSHGMPYLEEFVKSRS